MSPEQRFKDPADGSQSTLLSIGNVCLDAALDSDEQLVTIEDLAQTQKVLGAHDTHAGSTREVVCGIDECGESVTVYTEFNNEGQEVVTNYVNPRVSQPFNNCER